LHNAIILLLVIAPLLVPFSINLSVSSETFILVAASFLENPNPTRAFIRAVLGFVSVLMVWSLSGFPWKFKGFAGIEEKGITSR